ncbi:MAG: hypothetical protein FD166_1612 [Bacteroidetes bacterium]|nr:MAG: hypothetical protein FD166_1612 [Bacteroidota bacterium]
MKIRYVAILLILVIPALISESIAQEVSKSKPVFGVRYSTGFTTQVKENQNYRVIHLMPVFTVDFKNNCFYLGPEYAYFIAPEPSGSILYNNNGWGLNFGYRLNSNEFAGNLRIFGQFNYSIYQVRSTFFWTHGNE